MTPAFSASAPAVLLKYLIYNYLPKLIYNKIVQYITLWISLYCLYPSDTKCHKWHNASTFHIEIKFRRTPLKKLKKKMNHELSFLSFFVFVGFDFFIPPPPTLFWKRSTLRMCLFIAHVLDVFDSLYFLYFYKAVVPLNCLMTKHLISFLWNFWSRII